MKSVPFTKMHGCGNDYIYVNVMQHPIADPSAAAVAWSDRHKGIGSDGLVLIDKSTVPEADYSMRIFNADGSEAMMCGNASRCIGKYLYERRTHPWPLPVMEGSRQTLRESGIEKGLVFEDWLTHIHCYVFNYVVDDVQMKNLDTRQSQETDLSLLVTIPLLHREGPGVGLLLIEILSNTPRRIATHHGLTPVSIIYMHGIVGFRHRRFPYQHQTVGPDTFVAVAPGDGC